MRRFEERVCFVTGAASGIGAAVSRALVSEGARVVLADLDRAGAERLARELGPGALALQLDVRREEDWERAFEASERTFGRLDGLVHCAGISAGSPLVDTELSEWRRVLETNLDGAFLAVRAALRRLAGGGSIVLIGSASGIRPAAGAAAYSASKAALAMLARTAAKEARERKLRVNVVSPAGVKTALWRQMPFFVELVRQHGSEDAAFAALCGPGERFAEPGEVAAAVLFLLSDAAAHLTGVELPVDGGYTL
ncbi:MAG: SDR family oxidoreductase [Planctomycetota bacterium]|nr:SDR family oxidoreductase [Planctomycetota bacterium]